MKFSKLILLFIFGFVNCTAQPMIVRPSVKQLIFHGNSLGSRGNGNIVNAGEAPSAMYLAMTGNKPPMFNYSVSGKTIAQLITDFPTVVLPQLHRGDVVVMNEVTNTVGTTANTVTARTDMLQYRDSVWAHGAKIVVVTMTARSLIYPNVENDRLAINAWMLANAAQFDGVVDAGGNAAFNSVSSTTNTAYYNADALHFTSAGYTLYGQLIQAVIQPFFTYNTKVIKLYKDEFIEPKIIKLYDKKEYLLTA